MRKYRKRHKDDRPDKRLTRADWDRQRNNWRDSKRTFRAKMSKEARDRERLKRRALYHDTVVKRRLNFDQKPSSVKNKRTADQYMEELNCTTPKTKESLKHSGLIFTPNSVQQAWRDHIIVTNVKKSIKELKEDRTKTGRRKYKSFMKNVAQTAVNDIQMRRKLGAQTHFWQWCTAYNEEDELIPSRCDGMTDSEKPVACVKSAIMSYSS